MLVLTRTMGEEIRIGDDIVIMVFEVGDGRAELGITAPADVSIWREELRNAPAARDPATPGAAAPSRRTRRRL